MAKTRDRRVPRHPIQSHRTNSTSSYSRLYIFFFSIILLPILSFFVFRIKYNPDTSTTTPPLSIYERGLVKPTTNYQEILAENSRVTENTSRKHYTYPVLAYVTPWVLVLQFSGSMAKTRDRRVPRRPIQSHRTNSTSSYSRLYIFFFSIILLPILSFFVFRIKYNPDTSTTTPPLSVYERGLVKPTTNYQEILAENSRVSENTSRRHYTYPVLAYVTPWNSRGYDLAKKFNSKLSHLSPVWYDLKSSGSELVLEGRHNADLGWIAELRNCGDALVLPRFVIEAFPDQLLIKKKQRDKAINLIITECKEMGYDGVVLESWSRWAAYGVLHDSHKRNLAFEFLKQLGEALHSLRSDSSSEPYLQLIYVIGPPHSERLQGHDFGPEDLQRLSGAVDGFSLMTYDFSGPQNPGPNAPLKWVQAILRLLLGGTGSNAKSLTHKIFLGINFYGNDFQISEGSGGRAITGREYLVLLEKYRPILQWEEKSEEHMFVYADNNQNKHAVFYPSLMSISTRLEEARAWGTGISIWEIGQGLDYFFDLF